MTSNNEGLGSLNHDIPQYCTRKLNAYQGFRFATADQSSLTPLNDKTSIVSVLSAY